MTTTTETKTPAIYASLAKVMAEVGAIGKTRKNESQKYEFRGIDDVVAHVQDVMAQQGVICVPRVVERERELLDSKSGGKMASVRLLVEHTFYALDGSHVVCTTLGEAMDSGDKASNKAMSAALKYALTETLLIPTYEVDRDTEEQSPQMAGPPPRPPQSSPPRTSSAPPPTTAPKPAQVVPFPDAIGEWCARVEAADSIAALTAVGKAMADDKDARKLRENMRIRNAYTARMTALAAREKGGGQ
jgi:hypothetical protein